MNRWDGMEAFVAVAQHSHFARAAEQLGVSTSHISRQIARLEESLQTRLFYRSTRQVSLTESGQAFLLYCRQLQDGYDEAIRVVQDLASTPKGLLRMTCAVAYGERFIVPLVNEFMATHPGLQIEIDLSNQTEDIVHEGLDMAIRLGRVPDSRLVAIRLAPRKMYLCAAPEYLDRYGAPHSVSELSRHNCLIGTSDVWHFQSGGRDVSFRPHGNWKCNSGSAVLDAALRGFGLCHLPDYYVMAPMREGRLRALLPGHQLPDTAVWGMVPQQRHISPKVRLLIDHLKSGLAALPVYQQAAP